MARRSASAPGAIIRAFDSSLRIWIAISAASPVRKPRSMRRLWSTQSARRRWQCRVRVQDHRRQVEAEQRLAIACPAATGTPRFRAQETVRRGGCHLPQLQQVRCLRTSDNFR
jgi:hypothetical protein